MKIFKNTILALLLGHPLALSSTACASDLRLEGGAYRTVSNRFNIPNPGGSRVLVKDSALRFYGRGQLTLQVSERGYLRFMAAPLTAGYTYHTAAPLVYNGLTFPADSTVDITYKFNSYRLAYLYELVSSPSFLLRGGFVGKIREAKVAVRGSGLNSSYDNVGFVPLLNLGFNLRLAKRMDFRFDLDGAAAKQGRAFDGSAELFYRADDRGSGISGGIRILEGGADNSKVNTFALLDYAFLAITVGFGN